MPDHGYAIGERLGAGGMGTVYRAVHQASGRPVAVKTLRTEVAGDAMRRRLLLDEATAAARLRHPSIVELLDVATDEAGMPFLVMELVEGTHLGRLCLEWPGWEPVARVLDDALAGLVAAHAAGIIHRDLKPDNVLVDARGRGKIADFGVACVLDPRGSSDPAARTIAGTPTYMPIEQLGGGVIGPYTDLYAFGVLLHEVISGESPYPDTTLETLFEHKRRPPPPLVPRPGLQVPDELARLVADLIRPHPRERPRFARNVRDALAILAPRVVDRVVQVIPFGGPETSRPTAVPNTTSNQRDSLMVALAPTVPPSRQLGTDLPTLRRDPEATPRRTSLPAPTHLPAGADARPGASLLRLREPDLVGRDEDRTAIVQARDAVLRDGKARVMLLVGGTGVGKSRLARWAIANAEATATMDETAAGYDIGGATLGGLRDAILRLIGPPSRGTDGPDVEWAWLRALTPESDDLLRVGSWLAGAEEEALPAEQTADVAWLALRAASRVRPVLLWLDDVGWAQDGALELVERLAARPDPSVLVLATLREGTAQHPSVAARLGALAAAPNVSSRRIEPLRREDIVELIQAIVPLEDDIARALAPALDGTPLVAVQLLHDWLDSGALVAAARQEPEVERGSMPPEAGGELVFRLRPGETVASLLEARPIGSLLARRLDGVLEGFGARRLAAERVLLRAALLGVRFEHRALIAATRAHEELAALVDAVLDRALLHGVLRAEGNRAYRFDHGALMEALRNRAEGQQESRAAHRDAADAIVASYGSERPDVLVQVAVLLRGAGERTPALEHLIQGTINAAHQGNDAEARRLAGLAHEWLDEANVGELHPLRASVTMADGYVHYYALRYDQALASLRTAFDLFTRLGDVKGIITSRVVEAATLFHTQRYRACEQAILQLAATHYGRFVPVDHVRLSHRLAELAAVREDFEGALRHAREACEWGRKLGVPWRIELTVLNLAEVHLARGEVEEAAALTDPLAEKDEHGNPRYLEAEMIDTRARIALLRGDAVRARAMILPRVRRVEMLGDRWRLTALRLVEALCSVELDPPSAWPAAVRAFLAAFRTVAHEEAFTIVGMDRLADALAVRGEAGLAAEVRALRAERRSATVRGWQEE